MRLSGRNKIIAATLFVALLVVFGIFPNWERLLGTVEERESGSTVDFRFEDYSGDRYETEVKATEAAKADLYKLFPKGSQPEKLAEFIESIGGNCKERSETNYVETYGNALFCRYQHPYPGMPYIGHHWIVYILRQDDINRISKIQVISRIIAP